MRFRSSRRRPAKDDKPESAWSLARFFLTLVILTWALRSFIVQPFNIPSGSMVPTLYIGDYLIVAKWPYGFSRYSFPFGFPAFDGRIFSHVPARGDVVVFRHPDEKADLIKRVIGIPGDTVAVRDGRLILNGKAVALTRLPPVKIPVTANSPCRVVPPATPVEVEASGGAYCLYSASLETLPGGPSYTILDQVTHGPADDFAAVRVPMARHDHVHGLLQRADARRHRDRHDLPHDADSSVFDRDVRDVFRRPSRRGLRAAGRLRRRLRQEAR